MNRQFDVGVLGGVGHVQTSVKIHHQGVHW